MINYLTNLFGGLFSSKGVFSFILGMVVMRLVYWVKDSVLHVGIPGGKAKLLPILWALIFLFIGFISVQQQKTLNCQHEFATILKVRSDSNDQTDDWSRVKTDSIADWMHQWTFPPQDMLERRIKNNDDPVYRRWLWRMSEDHLETIRKAEQQQLDAIERRKQNPLPEPTCGK